MAEAELHKERLQALAVSSELMCSYSLTKKMFFIFFYTNIHC